MLERAGLTPVANVVDLRTPTTAAAAAVAEKTVVTVAEEAADALDVSGSRWRQRIAVW